LEEYIHIIDNKESSDKLKEDIEKSYIMIKDMKELIKKYEQSQTNTKIIQDVTSIYINQLMPLLQTILQTKYSKNSVEFNSDNNTFQLIQEKNTIEDITVHYSKPSIIHFVIGNNTKK
jgi:hypothetical protein